MLEGKRGGVTEKKKYRGKREVFKKEWTERIRTGTGEKTKKK